MSSGFSPFCEFFLRAVFQPPKVPSPTGNVSQKIYNYIVWLYVSGNNALFSLISLTKTYSCDNFLKNFSSRIN